ncbi:hypothetical protein [Celeribacter litoreus]|uniref:hypothetical protein n=1 Tax=Celeribacter litoreus TaxID=2876714 RepID=UPI001CCEB1BF|nr:hypothetical protein [Celeribacter litoreus]MCA0042994.1 hypothetical protein [Celeribacter litoreus]
MTDRDEKQMNEMLDALFAEAQQTVETPSEALMARILSDANAEIDARDAQEVSRRDAQRPKTRHPLIAAAVAALGGWRAVAGLATAGVTGIAIGLGAPGAVTSLATGYADTTSVYDEAVNGYGLDDLVPSFYELAAEG